MVVYAYKDAFVGENGFEHVDVGFVGEAIYTSRSFFLNRFVLLLLNLGKAVNSERGVIGNGIYFSRFIVDDQGFHLLLEGRLVLRLSNE